MEREQEGVWERKIYGPTSSSTRHQVDQADYSCIYCMYFINMPKMESLEDIHTVPNEFSQEDERKTGVCHLGQACPGRQNRRWRWREVWIWPRAAGASFVDRHLRASHSRQSAAANRQLIPPQLPWRLPMPDTITWLCRTEERLTKQTSGCRAWQVFFYVCEWAWWFSFGNVTAVNWEKAQGEHDDSKFRS